MSDPRVDRAWALVPAEGQPTRKVTYPEWCALVGTTTGEMAEAQELAEAEDWGEPRPTSDPIGRCPHCGTPIYTVPGFCGVCRAGD
jgi:hypothetical protein